MIRMQTVAVCMVAVESKTNPHAMTGENSLN